MSEQVPHLDVALAEIKLETEKCALERERLRLEQERTGLSFFQKNWQAVISVAVSVAAVTVSVGQFYSSRSVQRQEYAIRRVETLQKFLPDIASADKRDAALLLLVKSNLMDQSEVTSLALTFKSTRVLGDLNAGGYAPAGSYQRALNKEMADLINGVFSANASIRRASAAALISDWSNNRDLVPALLDHAAKDPQNENGIYNTVVLLESLRTETLRPYREGIISFVDAAKKIGPKTANETTILLRKLNTDGTPVSKD